MRNILIEYREMHSHQIIQNMKCMNSKQYITFNRPTFEYIYIYIYWLSWMADLNMNLKNLNGKTMLRENS